MNDGDVAEVTDDDDPGIGFWASVAIGAGIALVATVPVAAVCSVPYPF